LIDPNDLIPLVDAASVAPPLFPFRRGRPISEGTLKRWSRYGMGRDRVKLQTYKLGGTLCTTRLAAAKFLSDLNETTQPAEAQ